MSPKHRSALFLGAIMIGMATTSAHALDPAGEGRRAWLRYNCYGCHGMRANGGMGPDIRKNTRDDVWVALLGSGRSGGMRDYKTIMTFTDAINIGAYLATIGTPAEPKWNDWWRR